MRSIRVFYKSGNIVNTMISGTDVEIREYYVGKTFNLGTNGVDKMEICVGVEISDNPRIFAADNAEKCFRAWQNSQSSRLCMEYKNIEQTMSFDKFCLGRYTGNLTREGILVW